RMREAAAMWRAVTDAVGPAARDALWDYPDLMPSASDIDDPAALVARLEARARGEEPARDEMDDALARLLAGEEPGGPAAGEASGSPSESERPGDDGESGAPDDHRPV
ncbi:MAG TPA: zinc-dependent metalloprotease, partial [Microbacterium sp.]|nr:zinc-dependent metalloprotease [Microbacterium sp.]